MAYGLESFIVEFKNTRELYDVFVFICEYSTEIKEVKGASRYIEPKKVKYDELIQEIKINVVNKSNDIISGYIENLIKKNLLKRDASNSEEIILTESINTGSDISGASVYNEIISIEEKKERDKEIAEEFSNTFNDIVEPYEEKIRILEEKINEVNKTLDSGIIKNIQVISIFAGIISLLFANIMGIKDFVSIGVLGLLIINLCMVLAIFALLLFTKLLIVGGKIKIWTIIICIFVLLLLLVPIILINTEVINLFVLVV